MARITRKFIEARLVTTTNLLRGALVLSPTETVMLDQTGSDRYPWRVVILDSDDRRVITGSLTSNVTWHGVNAAVDALYEAAWHAQALRDRGAAKALDPVEYERLTAPTDPDAVVNARIDAAGTAAGRSAAGWWCQNVMGGRAPSDAAPGAQAILDGIADGDPAVLDTLPFLDLSGEMADGLTASDVLSDVDLDADDMSPEAVSDVLDRYRDAFDGAVVEHVEDIARSVVASAD